MFNQNNRAQVRFDDASIAKIDALCAIRQTTRSSIIREAVTAYLDRHASIPENPKRIAMLREFTQVALDVLIREQAPERREEILATVQDRMERYHAQG